MHINTVDLEDVTDAGLAYLMQVEQLELPGTLIEIVMQGDAVAPALILVKITLSSWVGRRQRFCIFAEI